MRLVFLVHGRSQRWLTVNRRTAIKRCFRVAPWQINATSLMNFDELIKQSWLSLHSWCLQCDHNSKTTAILNRGEYRGTRPNIWQPYFSNRRAPISEHPCESPLSTVGTLYKRIIKEYFLSKGWAKHLRFRLQQRILDVGGSRCAPHRFSAKSKGRKKNLRPCLIKYDVSALFLAPNLHHFHRLYIAGGQYRKRKA